MERVELYRVRFFQITTIIHKNFETVEYSWKDTQKKEEKRERKEVWTVIADQDIRWEVEFLWTQELARGTGNESFLIRDVSHPANDGSDIYRYIFANTK